MSRWCSAHSIFRYNPMDLGGNQGKTPFSVSRKIKDMSRIVFKK